MEFHSEENVLFSVKFLPTAQISQLHRSKPMLWKVKLTGIRWLLERKNFQSDFNIQL